MWSMSGCVTTGPFLSLQNLFSPFAKVGLCYLLIPSSTSSVKSEYFNMKYCGIGNRTQEHISVSALAVKRTPVLSLVL